MKRTKLLTVILAALMLTGCSGNSDYEKLQEQIDALQQQNNSLQEQLNNSGTESDSGTTTSATEAVTSSVTTTEATSATEPVEEKVYDDVSLYKYEENDDGGITITKYLGNNTTAVIPAVINGKTVTAIDNNAFVSGSSLASITIPDSVTAIGFNSFRGTPWFENYNGDWVIINNILVNYKGDGGDVVIPDGVTVIGDSVFSHCENLTSITIPDSVTSIGDSAFYCCENLINIIIPDSVTSIGDYAFLVTPWFENYNGDLVIVNNTLVGYKGDGGNVVVPNGVTAISRNTFESCSSLTSVTIPEGVTEIVGCAFSCCENLTSITIPSSVTEIGGSAFSRCFKLTSVTIPDGVTVISNSAFANCFSLTSVTIPDSVTEIAGEAFLRCSSLKSISIPDSVTEIGYDVFYDCDENLKINYKGKTYNPDSFDEAYDN